MILKKGERLDDLQFRGLQVIQHSSSFSFGIEALLLADFAQVKRGGVLVELGAGNGVALLLLAHRSPAGRLIGVELDRDAADRARRSVALNDLEERVKIKEEDLRNAPAFLGHGAADCVICNPPYFDGEAQAAYSPNPAKAMARHGVAGGLADWITATAQLLKNGGEACFVYRVTQLPHLLSLLEAAGLTPKVLQMLHHAADKEAKLLRLRAKKGGGRGLTVMPPLILYDDSGQPTPQYSALYRQEK